MFWKKLSTCEKEKVLIKQILEILNGNEILNLCASFNIMLNKIHKKNSLKLQLFDYTSEQKINEVLDSIKLFQILGPYFDPENFYDFISYFPLDLTSQLM